MIDDELGAFLAGPVMMVVATRGGSGRAAMARGLGAAADENGCVEMFVSAWQWPDAAAGFQVGAPTAMTFCRPSTYETYQVKGDLVAVRAADGTDTSRAESYVESTTAVLRGLGVELSQVARWLTVRDLLRLTLQPRALFLQTPGPSAGTPLEARV